MTVFNKITISGKYFYQSLFVCNFLTTNFEITGKKSAFFVSLIGLPFTLVYNLFNEDYSLLERAVDYNRTETLESFLPLQDKNTMQKITIHLINKRGVEKAKQIVSKIFENSDRKSCFLSSLLDLRKIGDIKNLIDSLLKKGVSEELLEHHLQEHADILLEGLTVEQLPAALQLALRQGHKQTVTSIMEKILEKESLKDVTFGSGGLFLNQLLRFKDDHPELIDKDQFLALIKKFDLEELNKKEKGPDGDTTLSLAASYGFDDVVAALLEKGVDANILVGISEKPALFWAIKRGKVDSARRLLPHTNFRNLVIASEQALKQPSDLSSQQVITPLIRQILEKESLKNFTFEDGELFLNQLLSFEARCPRSIGRGQLLALIEKLDLEELNKEGRGLFTALILADCYGFEDIVAALLDKGVDGNILK